MNQTKPAYKQQGNVGLFDSDETMERLNKMGNPLAKLQEAVDFEMFREVGERFLQGEVHQSRCKALRLRADVQDRGATADIPSQ